MVSREFGEREREILEPIELYHEVKKIKFKQEVTLVISPVKNVVKI